MTYNIYQLISNFINTPTLHYADAVYMGGFLLIFIVLFSIYYDESLCDFLLDSVGLRVTYLIFVISFIMSLIPIDTLNSLKNYIHIQLDILEIFKYLLMFIIFLMLIFISYLMIFYGLIILMIYMIATCIVFSIIQAVLNKPLSEEICFVGGIVLIYIQHQDNIKAKIRSFFRKLFINIKCILLLK